jgi:hypothetical protein
MNDARLRVNFGFAWLLLGLAFGLHIWDLAAHDFLTYYNATALALYGHFAIVPRMDLSIKTWLTAVILINLAFLALTPLAYRNTNWVRPIGCLFAGIAIVEGIGQILATLRGGTVGSVHFEGVAPGLYTAPLLLICSAFLLRVMRKSVGSAG